MYREITKEYIQEQEKLGINDVLLKFVEWRTFMAFFGVPLSEKDKDAINQISKNIVKKLLPYNEQLLFDWINHVLIVDSGDWSENLEKAITAAVFTKSGIDANIINSIQSKLQQSQYNNDLLLFFNDPPILIRKDFPCFSDFRFYELRILKETEQQYLYKNLWFEQINTARSMAITFFNIKDNAAILNFINNNKWDDLTYKNYPFSRFIEDFNLKDDPCLYTSRSILANYYQYVDSGFNKSVLKMRSRYD